MTHICSSAPEYASYSAVLRSSLDHSLDRLAPRAAQPSKLASSAVLAPWPATVAVDLWRRRTDQPASQPASHEMKYRVAIARICRGCQMIRRDKKVIVVCKDNPRHKQGQTNYQIQKLPK